MGIKHKLLAHIHGAGPLRYDTTRIQLDCDSMTRDRFFLGTMCALYALSIRGIRYENYYPSIMNLLSFNTVVRPAVIQFYY